MENTINTLIASSPVFTSELVVQGHQHVNVSIRPGASAGELIQDPVNSTVSAIFTLQRKLPGDEIWRSVQDWSVVTADGLDAEIEVITSNPEPETVLYQLGTIEDDYFAGAAFVRLGTS